MPNAACRRPAAFCSASLEVPVLAPSRSPPTATVAWEPGQVVGAAFVNAHTGGVNPSCAALPEASLVVLVTGALSGLVDALRRCSSTRRRTGSTPPSRYIAPSTASTASARSTPLLDCRRHLAFAEAQVESDLEFAHRPRRAWSTTRRQPVPGPAAPGRSGRKQVIGQIRHRARHRPELEPFVRLIAGCSAHHDRCVRA